MQLPIFVHMKTLKQFIFLYLKGIGMGSADVIPGVSGGTIAFITGIYEELLDSIRSVDKQALQLLVKGKIKALWEHINGRFLLVLFAGIGTALITLAKLLSFLLDEYPIQVWSFFFGLIIISAFLVARQIRGHQTAGYVLGLVLIAGVGIAYFITEATPAQTPEALWFVFLSGAIAICAMILPGISGSFILLILGKYAFVLDAVNERDVLVIGVFIAGCVIGLLLFSHVIGWLLHHYHNIAVALLAGFMIGSLNKIWPWKIVLQYRINSKGEEVPFITENAAPWEYEGLTGQDPLLFQAILFILLGIGFVWAIDFIAAKYSNRPMLSDEEGQGTSHQKTTK